MGGSPNYNYPAQPTYGEGMADAMKAQMEMLTGKTLEEGEGFEELYASALGEEGGTLADIMRKFEAPLRKETAQIDTDVMRQTLLGGSQKVVKDPETGKYGIRYDLRDEYFPAILFTSPDGIDLTPHEARILFHDGDTKPFTIVPQSLLHDATEPDPAKRFKAYGFTTLNLRRRGAACIYSADAVTWYSDIDGDGREEIVVGDADGNLVAFRWDGAGLSQVWDTRTRFREIHDIATGVFLGKRSIVVLGEESFGLTPRGGAMATVAVYTWDADADGLSDRGAIIRFRGS